MTFAQKLQTLRKRNKITQEKLAQMIGVERSSIGKYETTQTIPSNDILIKIANLFNVTTDYLLGNTASSEPPKKRGNRIPVLGNVSAGIPIDAITDIEDYEEIDEEMAKAGEFVGLRIKGDSMEPRMVSGDIVIVRIQNTANDGDTAIVLINGDEATCKKIKKTPDGIMLISTNPNYEPMFYSNKDIETLPVRIFGVVKELRAKY